VKVQTKYFKQYEKIMKMDLEQTIVKTSEYQSFSEFFPHIAESVRLEKKLERLTKLLKSDKNVDSKLRIKREISVTKSKLRKNNLFKRLHGENKPEAIFRRKFKRNQSKMRNSLFAKKFRTFFGRPIRNSQRKISKSMHKNLPPSIFNLRELDIAEKGLALREWLQEKRRES